MHNARDALQNVADAAAALNFAAVEDGATLGTLSEAVKRLARAVARVEVLALVDPDRPLDTMVPEMAFSEQDRLDRAMTLDVLETIGAMPTSTVHVAVNARSLGDDSPEDHLRQWMNGRQFVAKPAGHVYEIDANAFAHQIAQRFLTD